MASDWWPSKDVVEEDDPGVIERRQGDYWKAHWARQSQTAEGGHFRKLCKILLALYLAYAAFHVFTGLNRGCGLRMTLMVMTPIRELYTIPKIDRAFTENFTKPNANNNPAPELTAIAGWGIASLIKSSLTLDGCLLVNGLFGLTGDAESESANSWTGSKARPTSVPTPFQRRFNNRPYAKLTRHSVPIFAGTSKLAKQKGACTNPGVLRIHVEYRDHYRIRCAGTEGYVEKDFVRIMSGPPAARLRPQSAFLYALPKLSSQQNAICYQPYIQFVDEQVGEFFRVQCDGKKGWVEARHIQVLEE